MYLPDWGNHANESKVRHGITEKQIASTWVYGDPEPTYGDCWRLVGEEITLVLNQEGNFIITMYPNKKRDLLKAKLIKYRKIRGVIRKEYPWENSKEN